LKSDVSFNLIESWFRQLVGFAPAFTLSQGDSNVPSRCRCAYPRSLVIILKNNIGMTKKTLILISFIALKFLLQYFLISPEYELHRDEYLYLDHAHHLDWGFLTVPPLTSWISKLIFLLGNSVFWIKFFPALFGALTILVVWKSIEELKGNLFALILGATCLLFSILLRLNTLYQPNSFDVLSWTTFYFIVIKYINTKKTKWLYIAAAIFAIGFLNKYNIIFLFIGLLPALLLSNQREVLAKKQLYIAVVLGLLLILPNLIWQYTNHFPVIQHLKELSDTQLVHVNRFDFLKSQLLFFYSSLFVIILTFWSLFFYKPFFPYRLFIPAFVFTITAFIYFKAKDYYAIGLYPVYISFGSVFLADLLKQGWRKYLKPVAIAIPVLVFIPFYSIGFPNRSPEYIIQHSKIYQKYGLLRWEDGKNHILPQDYADMLGWKELAHKVDSIYKNLPNKDNTLVLCDNYGQAGAINFYTTQKIQSVSFNADYVNWFDLTKHYHNLIRVKEEYEKKNELQKTSPYFQTSIVADSIKNPYAREFGTTIFVFIGAKIDIRDRLKAEINKNKSH